jgi:hypothetical protein
MKMHLKQALVVEISGTKWLKTQPKVSYSDGTREIVDRWIRNIENRGDYVIRQVGFV